MTAFKGLFSSSNAKVKAESSQNKRRLSSNTASKPGLAINIQPPFPHPLPHKLLNVVASDDGIILYPCIGGSSTYQGPAALVPWAKATKVERIDSYDSQVNRKSSRCTVYGIAGILDLFQG